jgi:hypothetical protein
MAVKNLVSDYGAVGDAQKTTTNVTVVSGSPTLTVGSSIFAPGDVGKAITIWNALFVVGGLASFQTTIAGYTSATQVTMGNNSTANITASSSFISWGTDNTLAFTGPSGFRAWAQTQTNPADPPVLEIPDGVFGYKSSSAAGGGLHHNVINDMTIRGTSGNPANCKLMQFAPNEMRFGNDVPTVANRGLQNAGGNSARLQTAAAGASTVTLVDPAGTDSGGATYGSRIVVGRACLIASYDHQGLYESFFGYPPNSFFTEWNKITAYDTGTGVVTLETPLVQAHKSTYPRWGLLSTTSGADQGGPATIWVAPDGYNQRITIENLTFDCEQNQSSVLTRHVTLNNCLMEGPGVYPTQCDTFTATDCVFEDTLEVDKLVNIVTWNNCTHTKIQQQSASPNKMYYNGGSIRFMETGRYVEATGVDFTGPATLHVGASAYGRTDRVIINNCTNIAVIERGGSDTTDLRIANSPVNASAWYTFVGGVMRFAKADSDGSSGTGHGGQQNASRLFAPGAWVSFDNGGDRYLDQVVDVYEDGTYCYIQWANTTDWPFTPVVKLKTHPCPDFTMRNCTGTAGNLEDFNNAPDRAPMYSYSRRTRTAGASGTTAEGGGSFPFVFGALQYIKETVTVPYVAVGSLTHRFSQFTNWPVLKSDYSSLNIGGTTVNMKTAGVRTIAPNSAGTGAVSGDSLDDLSTSGTLWMYRAQNNGSVFSANVTNGETPTVITEISTDQGIPSPVQTAVMPLRFRLRA